MIKKNFPLVAVILSFFTVLSLALEVKANERVVHTFSVNAGKEISLPQLEETGKLLGWRLVIKDPTQLKSAETCEEKRCGELVIKDAQRGESKMAIPGRFGAMKALGVRSGGSELPTVEIASLGDLYFHNTAEFAYNVEILVE